MAVPSRMNDAGSALPMSLRRSRCAAADVPDVHRKSGGEQAVAPWFRGNEFSMWDAAQFVQQVIYCHSAPEGLMWAEDNEMICKADRQV